MMCLDLKHFVFASRFSGFCNIHDPKILTSTGGPLCELFYEDIPKPVLVY